MAGLSGSSGPLIGVAALARELSGPAPPTLLDVRWRLGGPPGIDDYRAGHLPGAVFTDLDRDLSGPPGEGGRHPLPTPAAFQAAMRRAGVTRERPVVVYDEGDSVPAARAWWTLRYYGHPRVRLLDGGYRAWVRAGGEVATGDASAPAAGDFTATPGQMPLLGAGDAARLARRGTLLDARAAERYRGEVEPVDPVPGHIPGAVSAPAAENLGPDGRFLPPAKLRARFARLGVARSGHSGHGGAGDDATRGAQAGGGQADAGAAGLVGAYCGSGVTAANEVLALAIAGIPAALYAGSWSHWVTDPSRPVATGPGRG